MQENRGLSVVEAGFSSGASLSQAEDGTLQRPPAMANFEALYDDSGPLFLTNPESVKRARRLIRHAYHDYVLHTPRPESLHMVIRLNLFNALARNAITMGFPIEGLCKGEYISPFNAYGPYPAGFPSATTLHCPTALQPTALQGTILHHPWIDLFPFPTFRDNILLAIDAGLLDDDDLCCDVLELWASDLESRPSLVIWGESSDWRSWEASPSFMRKWGWLLRDCPEIVSATNFWREKRGQQRLTASIEAE